MGSRIDWFDGSVVEEPTICPNTATVEQNRSLVSHAIDADPRRIQIPDLTATGNGNRQMGFMRLSNLANTNSAAIILQLTKSKHSFYDLFEQENSSDYYVLIIKIISKISDDSYSETKRCILKRIHTHSKFWKNMSMYLRSLPKVKIVEKNTNMHFWNDPEQFYHNTLRSLEVFLTMFPDQLGTSITPRFCDLQDSIVGVTEVHSERFSTKFLERVESFQLEMLRLEEHNKQKASFLHLETAHIPELSAEKYYKNISVYPLPEDLLGETPNIEPKRDKSYDSFHQYVDRQFRMVREDCYGPLRDEIKEFLLNPKTEIYQNIQIYEHVRFSQSTVLGMKIGYLVKLNYTRKKQKKRLGDNQLIFGCLVIFTRDNFKTILTGTVLDRDPEGSFVVELSNLQAQHEIFDHDFTLVESKVFFEAYRHVLSVLQNLREDEMPFKDYILQLSKDVRIPSYVLPTSEYTIDLGNNRSSVNIYDEESWPDLKDANMDTAQYKCFRAALSRELAIIQGPPGTGKTFIGLQIVKTLLKNINLEAPILLICYTNHALDQFLEATLEFTKNIVRLGSQSKNLKLDAYNILSLRGKVKSQHKDLYNEKKKSLEDTLNQMNHIQTFYEVMQNELISYETLSRFMNIEMRLSLCRLSDLVSDPIFLWLFGSELGYTMEQIRSTPPKIDADLYEDTTPIPLRSCFTLEQFEQNLEQLKAISENVSTDQIYEMKREKIHNCIIVFKEKMKHFNFFDEPVDLENLTDFWDLPLQRRWVIYFALLRDLQKYLNNQFAILQKQYTLLTAELEHINVLVDRDALSGTKVLGMTTSGASRMNALLQTLNISIVLVEEAAEIPEAHVVASLPKSVQHLIMIGDHLQLRPATSNYELVRMSDFGISLFERLVRSGVRYTSLHLQHRMRPEIAELLCPHIYPELKNAKQVLQYPCVKGMSANLFFVSHEELEEHKEKGSTSYCNMFEVEMCVKLALHLISNGCLSNEITFLTLYTGQVALIRQLISGKPELENSLVTTVDNYQGEENRIVVLSLVRSNKENRLGFLNLPNRICVALSRATEGLYMIGNMKMLCLNSPTWNEIHNILKKKNAIGYSWPIVL